MTVCCAEDEDELAEDAPAEKELSLADAYEQLWRVIRLPSVRVFAVLLVTFRLAVLPAEAVAPLKLLEKGVSKEALAGLVCAPPRNDATRKLWAWFPGASQENCDVRLHINVCGKKRLRVELLAAADSPSEVHTKGRGTQMCARHAGADRVPLRAAVGGDGRAVGRRRYAIHALDERLLAAADDGSRRDDPGISWSCV